MKRKLLAEQAAVFLGRAAYHTNISDRKIPLETISIRVSWRIPIYDILSSVNEAPEYLFFGDVDFWYLDP